MTGFSVAALALAAALVVSPSSPRRRLGVPGPRVSRAVVVCPVVGAAAVVAITLPPTTVLAAALVAATVGLRYRRRRRRRRGIEESRALETAIDVLVGELRVGAHPVQAFEAAAAETSGRVADCCRAVAARARLGADVAAGLRGAAGTSVLPGQWERLAVCWQLAGEHGLAMSALMRTAQRDIAERQRFSASVTASMAGAHATTAILASLPVLSVLLGQAIGARPVAFLLHGHAGGWLLVVGVTLACAGLLWSDRITDRVTQ